MADNFEATAGSGTTFSADDIGAGVLAQNVKLLDGTGAATAPIAADIGAKANALRVAPADDITDATYLGDIKFGESLPAGTAAIGKLATNTGVDIGDVDVTSVVPGVGATNLGKAEDAAHTTGDTGVMGLTVRQDTAAALGGTDADYQPLITDASGRLHVTGPITAVVPGTAATNLGKAEDAAHSTGDVGVMPLTVRQDTAVALGGTDADYQPLITDANGRLHTNALVVGTIADDATTPGAPVMIGGKAVETDGTDPTSVSAEADVAILRTDRNRRLLVNDAHPALWTTYDEGAAAEADTSLKAAPAAGLSLYVTDVVISNGATAGYFFLESDPTGAKTQLIGKIMLGVNGHAELHYRTPLRLAAATALGYTCVSCQDHSISVNGYTGP